ncbi:MAG: aminopeptidase, partial [Chloroflexi bacterium]|nr:aminopeptidase [Chloroflexota bacterium]
MKTKEFYEKLEKYAEIGIKVGLNVQPGQRVAIRVTTSNIEFSRALARQAYLAGAKFVDVLFYDEPIIKTRFENAPKDSFEEINKWMWGTLHEYGEAEDALLTVVDYDPDLLLGFDSNSVNTYQKTDTQHRSKVTKIVMGAETNRLAIGAATPYWAAKLFPETPKEEQLGKMWELMFELARINADDPLGAWQAHVQNLNNRCVYLNQKQYAAYKFTGPGTDLRVGMPKNHFWGSAEMESTTNILSLVNIPTEEVFCGPDRNNVNGTVSSTKPLVIGGSLIDKLK